MKVENIDIQETIEDAKAALSNDKAMSATTKSVMKLLLILVSILINKLNLNSTNSSKPPSSDTNILKKKRFNKYEFILLSTKQSIEKGKFYLSLKAGNIIYKCLSLHNTIQRGADSTSKCNRCVAPKEYIIRSFKCNTFFRPII